jgi:hypothetical protein
MDKFEVIDQSERATFLKYKSGNLVFDLPEDIRELVETKLEFDMDMLNIDAEPTVLDLVRHLSVQAANESYLSTQAAYIRNQLEVMKQVYETWWHKTSHRHMGELMELHKSKYSGKIMDAYMYATYSKDILKFQSILTKLDTKYRDVCGIRDAYINKGKYLQTLRNLIEPNPIKGD